MKFAIILPTIGRETLNRAVESVLNQTYQNWTLYVIGDGIVAPQFEDKRIKSLYVEGPRVVKKLPDSGAFARNAGIKISTEEWITFLDDDDIYLPNYLSIIAHLKKINPNANLFKTAAQEMHLKHKHSRSSKRVLKCVNINYDDPMTITLCCSRKLFNKTSGWKSEDNHDHILFYEMLDKEAILCKTDIVTCQFLR